MAPFRARAIHINLPRLLYLCCSLIAATTVSADPVVTDCPSNANYTRGGAFQANLDALLSSLPAAAAAASGFAENTTGVGPDEAYGLAQCRADVGASECRACLDASVQDVAKKCPGQKSSTLIYDYCLQRHSNASFFGAADASPVLVLWNPQSTTQPEQFMSLLGKMMGNLTNRAAHASPRMFAADEADLPFFVKIYGMAQCTRDLAADDCYRCLVGARDPAVPSNISQTLSLALSSHPTCASVPDPQPLPATTTNSSYPAYFRFIHEDLHPWRAAGGITRAMLDRARATASFRLVVIRGSAYAERIAPAFQTRDLFTIWGVLQMLHRYPGRVPDLDLMFDCVDWPVIRADQYQGENATVMPPNTRVQSHAVIPLPLLLC